MAKTDYSGLTMYEFSPSQEATVYQQDFCLHKNVDQVPVYMIFNREMDWDLLTKAVNVEIERNDCLRLRFLKTGHGRRECFLPEYQIPQIPVHDFTGKSKEEMLEGLGLIASKPIRYLKGETFVIHFFRAFDGRYGIFLCISHLAMDIAAVFVFFKDLIEVYESLASNTPMPKPLCRFEDSLRRDLEKAHNKEKYDREDAFFVDYFANSQPSFYAGVDGMRQLNKARQKKKNPTLRYVNIFDPFHDKSANLMVHEDGNTMQQLTWFAEEQHVPFQSLIYLGMRTHLSAINERTDDVYFHMIVNRRSALQDLNCGGDRMHVVPMRTILQPEMTFEEALNSCALTQMKMMRYADHPTRRVFDIVDANEHRAPGGNTSTMLFSCLPLNYFKLPDGWSCEFGGCSTGRFAFPEYSLLVPSLVDGGMDFYYEYQTHRFTKEDLLSLHRGTMKAISMGMENPQITIGELLDALS